MSAKRKDKLKTMYFGVIGMFLIAGIALGEELPNEDFTVESESNSAQDLTPVELELLLGTGVGNATEGEDAVLVANFRTEFGRRDCRGGGCGFDEFNLWCTQVTKILRKASRRAEKRVGRHDLRGASYLLKSALEEAKRSLEYNEDDGGPITRLLVERGVQLTLALVEGEKIVLQRMKKRGATQEEIRRKANQLLISRVRFMSLYVDELILERGRALDDYVLPYYFRYERCRRGACNRDYVDRFSEQFRLFVQEQIDFLEGYFIVPTSRRGVFPRGQGMHYLIAAEQMSESMGIDLQMYSDFHSCTGLDLENLSEDLRDYNWSGSRDLFRNEREAVNDVSQELNLASSSLSSCPYDWSEFEMDGDER